jgi:hypothetical protein
MERIIALILLDVSFWLIGSTKRTALARTALHTDALFFGKKAIRR